MTRDLGLYLLGVGILIHQTLLGPVNVTLVTAAVTLCFGTPLAFRTEEFVKSRTGGK